jgi:ATP-binding cassette subfamily B multidrug efflux pump
MKNILRNLLPYKAWIAVLVILLVIQAWCDLSLPQYTQDIIDVGIQNSGVEHILPEKITSQDMEYVLSFMDDAGKKTFSGSYELSGKKYKGKKIYSRKSMSEEKLDRLDSRLLTPVVTAAESRVAEIKGGSTSSYSGKKVKKTIDSMGKSTLMAVGVRFAVSCDRNAGVDVDKIQSSYLWKKGGAMFLMSLLMFIVTGFTAFIASRTGASVARDLREKVFSNVMKYSGAEMDRFSTASLITRCTNDVQQVQMVTTMILRMVLYAPVMGIWGIIKAAGTGAGMSWILALGVILAASFVLLLMNVTLPKYRRMQSLVDALNRVSREILTGLLVIRAFGREEQEEKRFDRANRDLMETQLFTSRVMSLMQPVIMLLMNVLSVAITWTSAHLINQGTMQVGTMTAFITYSMMIIISFLMISVISIILPRAGVAADRIEEVITTEPTVTDTAEPETISPEEHGGDIVFSHVDFRYPGAEDDALSDISFTAKAGEMTAVIGSTGSGKSTLVGLIPRFYDVTGGSITIDGHDIRKVKLRDLREMIGYVPQKGVLFSGTIESNIRFGKKDASESEIREAAETAQASDFIDEKEKGYKSFISQGGSNVSGGQKQRIAIARAIAKSPEILIFDDSFSALDMKTDAELRKALAVKEKKAAKIVVAQRISTILNADMIVVLDEGRVAGKGRHSELMKTCPVYRQIAESQLSMAELEGIG